MRTRHLIVTTALLAACSGSNTKLVNTWVDPTAGSVRLTKVMAVCMCQSEGLRRTVEDRLSAALPGSQPSYTLLPQERFENIDEAKAALQQGNFDGAVVMNLVSVERTATVVPGTPYVVPYGYRGLWEAWGFRRPVYGVAYDPGYIQRDKLVNYDTNVYTAADGRLVWASRSQTDNPSSVQDLVDEVVKATVKAMKKQNIVVQ